MCRMIFGAIMFVIGCSKDPASGGTSTSENGCITGKCVDNDGAPVLNTPVALVSENYSSVNCFLVNMPPLWTGGTPMTSIRLPEWLTNALPLLPSVPQPGSGAVISIRAPVTVWSSFPIDRIGMTSIVPSI